MSLSTVSIYTFTFYCLQCTCTVCAKKSSHYAGIVRSDHSTVFAHYGLATVLLLSTMYMYMYVCATLITELREKYFHRRLKFVKITGSTVYYIIGRDMNKQNFISQNLLLLANHTYSVTITGYTVFMLLSTVHLSTVHVSLSLSLSLSPLQPQFSSTPAVVMAGSPMGVVGQGGGGGEGGGHRQVLGSLVNQENTKQQVRISQNTHTHFNC